MRLIIICLATMLLSLSSYSQETKNHPTIEESMDSLYKKSSSWEFYKIIKKDRYQNLKKEILDSLKMYKDDIRFKSNTLKAIRDTLRVNKIVINDLNTDIKLSFDKRNEIQFLGISFTKTTYQILVWSLIVILLIFLFYFIYQYKNSHVITKNAQNELSELEEEFAMFKKKTMTKEQKLRRQLQDEINKQRGV